MHRIFEAVSEIKKTARKYPILGAEDTVLFLEKVSEVIAYVDCSVVEMRYLSQGTRNDDSRLGTNHVS